MMLASHELRVVPLTVHCALAEVPKAITRALIFETVRTTYAALRRDFGIAAPRIAVAGLNPHAGEEGTMGREEIEIIAPAIADLRAEGLSVTGPHSADTLFHAAARRTYDAVIAMYHDQALIPLKTSASTRASTSRSACRSCAPRPTTAPRSTSPPRGAPQRTASSKP